MSKPTKSRRVSDGRTVRLKKTLGPEQKRVGSRVSGVMHVYLITNKVNGKRYVGKTTRKDPRRRWCEHTKDGRKTGQTIISRALRKYGEKAFSFEVIETHTDPVLLAERESFYIRQYNTLSPHGYNVILHQPHFTLTPEARANKSRTNQGIPKSKTKTSPYLGVYRKGGGWAMEIAKNRESYHAFFSSEDEAARGYDMMALYLYGSTARLNFDASGYSREQIDRMYQGVMTSTKTSAYKGVDYVTCRKRWRTVVRLDSQTGKKTWTKGFDNEVEAAKAYDRSAIHFLKAEAKDLNFPSLYPDYVQEDLAAFCHRNPKSSRYWGVSYRKDWGTYRAKFKHGGVQINCGNFPTEQEAHLAVQAKLKQIGAAP